MKDGHHGHEERTAQREPQAAANLGFSPDATPEDEVDAEELPEGERVEQVIGAHGAAANQHPQQRYHRAGDRHDRECDVDAVGAKGYPVG